jgi:hypothetical protein
VLFWIPVTGRLILRLVLGLILGCHSSYRRSMSGPICRASASGRTTRSFRTASRCWWAAMSSPRLAEPA